MLKAAIFLLRTGIKNMEYQFFVKEFGKSIDLNETLYRLYHGRSP
jgi:hypothetical protein